MDVDQETAIHFGFPKPKYMAIERERRWLCIEVPNEQVRTTEQITDFYVTGAQLRLRKVTALNGDSLMFKLTRKADVDCYTRLITSIYLPEHEFRTLASALTSRPIKKFRHRLQPLDGVSFIVDEFQGNLAGLKLVEAEFETVEELLACPVPPFAGREVTKDQRFSGGSLAASGIPSVLREA